MQRTLSFAILILFTLNVQAQWYTQKYGVNDLNELSQAQMEFSLSKTEKNIKTGKILTYTGLGAGMVGMIIGAHATGGILERGIDDTMAEFTAGGMLMLGGITCMVIGIPLWAVNANRRNEIEIALLKFNTTSYLGNNYPTNFKFKQPPNLGLSLKINF